MVDRQDVLITDRVGLRSWFELNASTARECYIWISLDGNDGGILYLDAVEEALCFGWIDGHITKIEGLGLVRRFSPRQKRSNWTELNKARCERLERLGLMTDAGREALSQAPPFGIDDNVLSRLREDPVVYANFLGFPELYRRVRIDNIQRFRKSRPDLFKNRLDKFVEKTRKGMMYGEWNDGGRLP